MAKGSQFERKICKELSLWWTSGKRDDVFWRTQNSGGRAAIRTRKGKSTSGQYGDIASTDKISAKFTRLFTIELKVGYAKHTFVDLFDLPAHRKQSTFEGFLEQVGLDKKESKTPYWMLISKRNSRDVLVFIPYLFYKYHRNYMEFRDQRRFPIPFGRIKARFRLSSDKTKLVKLDMICMKFELFKEYFKPEIIKKL